MSERLFPEQVISGQGDVLDSDALQLLESQSPGSVKLIVTDPPYGIAYHSGHYKKKNPHAPVVRDWNFQIGDFFRGARRALAEDGAIYLFTRFDVYPIWVSSIRPPLKLKNCIVWLKDNWSAGDLEGNFGNQYELILFITKGDHKIRGKRWPNVWEFARVPFQELRMATEKPTELLKRAILSSSDPGDVVVDPYCGSGSTGEAATLTGRRFLLSDIDPSMVSMARNRLGLPSEATQTTTEQSSMPKCPILNIVPPEPHLWGVHPEDISRFIHSAKFAKEGERQPKEEERA